MKSNLLTQFIKTYVIVFTLSSTGHDNQALMIDSSWKMQGLVRFPYSRYSYSRNKSLEGVEEREFFVLSLFLLEVSHCSDDIFLSEEFSPGMPLSGLGLVPS